MLDSDEKKNLNNIESSSEEEEDDFFKYLDEIRGVSDEQIKERLEDTSVSEEEVTRAFETLSPDQQEIFSRTQMMHFDRDLPVEQQMHHAIRLQKYKERKRTMVSQIIMLLMVAGILISTMGLIFNKYLKNRRVVVTDTTNSVAVKDESENISINESSFPDEKFRNYVLTNIDTNGDGQLSAEERNKVVIIKLQEDSRITSLKGIEYFPLLQVLDASKTSINQLDLSINVSLESINVSYTKLYSLDVSKCNSLKSINISNTSINSLALPSPSSVVSIVSENNSLNCSKDENNYYIICS